MCHRQVYRPGASLVRCLRHGPITHSSAATIGGVIFLLNLTSTVRLDGKLTQDVSYRLYVRSEFDAFAREKDANAAFALLGARLTRNVLGWNASIIYENRYDYAGVYQDLLFTSYDIKGALSRDYFVSNWIFTPSHKAGIVRPIWRRHGDTASIWHSELKPSSMSAGLSSRRHSSRHTGLNPVSMPADRTRFILPQLG